MNISRRGASTIITGLLIVLFCIGIAVVTVSDSKKKDELLSKQTQLITELEEKIEEKDKGTKELYSRFNLLNADYIALQEEHSKCPK